MAEGGVRALWRLSFIDTVFLNDTIHTIKVSCWMADGGACVVSVFQSRAVFESTRFDQRGLTRTVRGQMENELGAFADMPARGGALLEDQAVSPLRVALGRMGV
jgi:hypothetical protein